MFSVQAAAIAGGAAFILSLVTGMISGAGFGLVLFRSIAGGAVFFGLAAAGEYILRTFLPELFEESGQQKAEPSVESSEPQVDIILDDEDDVSQDTEPEDNEPDETRPVSKPVRVENADTSPVEEDDFIEEVGSVEEAESLEESENYSEEDSREFENIDTDNVEELPSLDSFSDTFESYGDSEDDSDTVIGQRDMNVDVLGENQSVEDVAKAVQTILKKDSEG